MKIIFMGTPEFAVPSLRILVEKGYVVSAVVTQPDRPQGRKQILTSSPIKIEAQKHSIFVFQPEKLRHPDAIDVIRQLAPDLIVTVAYGQILPKAILQLPRFGCINVHASLLPKYRGGAPIHYAIMRGEQKTGVTIMFMEEGLDTGPIISQSEVAISAQDTTGTLFVKLSELGSKLLIDTIPQLIEGKVKSIPQNHNEAVYAPNIKREDEKINWFNSASSISCQVRGLNPFPGAYTLWKNELIKIWSCEVILTNSFYNEGTTITLPINGKNITPGTICDTSIQGIDVLTGKDILRITEVQPAGKKIMTVQQWIRGVKIVNGDILG